jgi:hypothetical protein
MIDTVKRVNYFDGQFLVADDFHTEQNYHRQMRYHHNQALHIPGIVAGLVVAKVSRNNKRISVSQGSAIDAQGQEMILPSDQTLDLANFGANALVFITIQFSDSDRDESDRRAGDFARIPERSRLELTEQEPPKDNSVIILAQVQLNAQGNVGTIDLSVRSKLAGAAIAPDTVSLEQLASPVRELITGHTHDGTNSQRISPTHLAGVDPSVTSNHLNRLCGGANQDASNLHFHPTIPQQTIQYNVPLTPVRVSEIRRVPDGFFSMVEKPPFQSDGNLMGTARNNEGFGMIPLQFPTGAQLNKLSFDLSATLLDIQGNPNIFRLVVEIKHVTATNQELSVVSIDIDSRRLKFPTGVESRSMNHTVSNSGRYWLAVSVTAIPNVASRLEGGVAIRSVVIDYTFNRLF